MGNSIEGRGGSSSERRSNCKVVRDRGRLGFPIYGIRIWMPLKRYRRTERLERVRVGVRVRVIIAQRGFLICWVKQMGIFLRRYKCEIREPEINPKINPNE